jgi:hypothetical protein
MAKDDHTVFHLIGKHAEALLVEIIFLCKNNEKLLITIASTLGVKNKEGLNALSQLASSCNQKFLNLVRMINDDSESKPYLVRALEESTKSPQNSEIIEKLSSILKNKPSDSLRFVN